MAQKSLERAHRAGRRGFFVVAEVSVHVGKRRQVDRREKRLVSEPVVDARARDGGGAEGSAVEGAPEGDDAGPPGHPSRELERSLDGLRAGIAEEDRVQRLRACVGEHCGQPPDRLQVAEGVADVEQLVGLVLDRRGHRRVVVAE